MVEGNLIRSGGAANAPPGDEAAAMAAELQRLKRKLAINRRITEVFLLSANDEMYGDVLQVILEAAGSEHGVFGYIDEQGGLVCPSMTPGVWQQCQVDDQSIRYPRESWTDALWYQALRDNRIVCANQPARVPDNHVSIARSVSVPIALEGHVIGIVHVANKRDDYDQEDIRLLEDIADCIVPLLHARLRRDREERECQRRRESLREIEWLLERDAGLVDVSGESCVPRYGDAAKLNNCREVIDSVGVDLLRTIVSDYLDLVDTSAAVYEKNGDYALGILTSGWCRLLDEASRELCMTADNREALHCGKWLCHESCWTDVSRAAIESGQSVDVECNGGIRLFAVPIRAGDEVVGSINFGYGDPPQEGERLSQIAQKYRLGVEQLLIQARSYESRPPDLIAVAKKRLLSCARLIGAIVERKRAQTALKESEERFRSTFELAAMGIAHVTLDGYWLRVNQKLCDIVGYSREELARRTIQDITHPDDLDADLQYVRQMLGGEIATYSMEKRYLRKDGETIWVNLMVSLLRGASGEPKHFISVVEDISARKRMEREVESVARFPLENPYPVLRVAKDGQFLFANRTAELLVNHPDQDANEAVVAVWRQRTVEALQAEAALTVEIQSRGATLSFLVVPLPDAEYANWYGRDVTEQRQAEKDARQAQAKLLEHQRGETVRVAAELQKAREEIVRKTRLASIGQISASIAHELRNPLGAARNAVYWLKRHVPKDEPELTDFLQIIEDEVGRADRIIGSLLEASRSRPTAKRSVELPVLVHDSFRQVADTDGVRFRVATTPEPFPIHVDPDQFRQVMINLLTNAVQAMKREGDLLVEATCNGKYDIIVVRDSGPGIPDDLRPEVFEPLVTRKAKGTGLGLTICRQIIESHGGTIELARDEQPGAAFRITLPRG